MNDITLSPQQLAEMAGTPYSPEDAMCAIKLGFIHEMSDAGLLPSEVEAILKEADYPLGGFLNGAGQIAGLSLAGGALVGGYTGYLRHRAEKAVEGKNDPDLTKLNNSLKMYRELVADLNRTNAVAA